MGLFNVGHFVLHSGDESVLKIDCDSLADTDWEALAYLAQRALPPFSEAVGVPTGGEKFAKALNYYARPKLCEDFLGVIADDVLTTGRSIREHGRIISKNGEIRCLGVVAFARGRCPSWVTPIFQLNVSVV